MLRGGTRPPLESTVPPASYYVVLSRALRRPNVEVWPIQLSDPLPLLPVPLLEPDLDVPLNLGQSVATIYEESAYGLEVDYRQSPPPPVLSEAEAENVAQVMGNISFDKNVANHSIDIKP